MHTPDLAACGLSASPGAGQMAAVLINVDIMEVAMKMLLQWRIVMLVSAISLSGVSFLRAESTEVKMDAVKKLERMAGLGRKIVSENQALFNDPAKGDKGFDAESFRVTLTKYLLAEKIDLDKEIKAGGLAGESLKHLLESQQESITDAQPRLNKKGVGFKGYIPAVFARESFEYFAKRNSKIQGKLTAILVRNANNAPDVWEKMNLQKFMAADYPRGTPVVMTTDDGTVRYIKPEYYTEAAGCLKCHGDIKGERDITGGLKEGYKDGAPGAALSFVVK